MIEYNEEYDRKILELVKNYPRSYFKKISAKSNKDILDYIDKCTPLLQDGFYVLSTKVYWVLNHMQEFPRCKTCGKEIRKNVKVNEGYPSYCRGRCSYFNKEVEEKRIKTCSERYGEGIVNPFQSDEIIKKIDETNFRKYGVRRFTQTQKYRDFINLNHDKIEDSRISSLKKNNSFNESKFEKIAFDILKFKYKDLRHPYKSEKYPFCCDFYSPSEDLYIEYNGTWTHGGHFYDPMNKEDERKKEEWCNKNTDYYDKAVYTWTDLDVRKRKCAVDNNLNYLVFWNIEEVYDHVYGKDENIANKDDLVIKFDRKRLEREYSFYRDHKRVVDIQNISNKNYIIKFFQQDTFFANEKRLWKDNLNETRKKILENRAFFLHKDFSRITDMDILVGFKKSAMFYGYSHFNPLWFKFFIDRYGVRKCYDPCGGWGHRLLGGLSLEKYIYNDLSRKTKENIDRIVDYFKIENCETHCEDARDFIPDSDFDSMFTCPPYFNLEHYECGDFNSREEFDGFVDSIFDVFNKKDSCRIFGIVIREDMIGKHDDYSEKFPLNVKESSHISKKKNFEEFLYVYRK